MLKSTAYLRPCSVRQPKTLPLRQEGAPEGGGSVSLPQSPFLQGGVLQGRFLHFCMEDSYITNPPQYKNVRMTCFIYINQPAVIVSGYM